MGGDSQSAGDVPHQALRWAPVDSSRHGAEEAFGQVGQRDSRLAGGAPFLIYSAQRCRIAVQDRALPSWWRSPAAKPGLSDFLAVVGRQARGRVEEEPLRVTLGAAEGQQVQERAGLRVKGEVPDPSRLPIVLDEAEDRALVGHGVVDEVA